MGGGVDFEAVTLIAEKASTRLRTAINRFGISDSICAPESTEFWRRAFAIAFKKRRAYI